MQVKPVTGDVDRHRQLKPEHVLRVKMRQRHQQAHRAATIRQLVQHRPELRALVKMPGRVPVERVQQRAHHVAPHRDDVIRRHVIKRHDGEHNPRVPCKSKRKQKHATAFVCLYQSSWGRT